ncbi:MAG: DEAD/DEAH box helicase [Oscillospiraceae bacterium]
MTDVLFSQLDLAPEIMKAVTEMGFDVATPVQAQVIPLVRTGVDVIARSQTGTGKTVAFAIPALEAIDTTETKPTVQVIILCPTRELAQQAGVEIRKLTAFMPGVRAVELFGGSDMQRQIMGLRRANLVVGTPGRVMDHMRRGSLKLQNLKMIILDEADEMLEMGFKEDIETILQDVPEEHQTVLLSATMPPAILAITKKFQKNPQMVDINKSQVTLDNITQTCVDVPMGKKQLAMNLLLRYHQPNRALVFCNTKHMVDELAEYLNNNGFAAESIHGDLKQSQRTSVMNSFKQGKVSVLIATDVAARGIDVNDLDFVFNYDIPTKTEYYVHRIGRTGRAGKLGMSITLCCGRRQIGTMRGIAHQVKAEITQVNLPSAADVQKKVQVDQVQKVIAALETPVVETYTTMLAQILESGHTAEEVAATLLGLQFPMPKEIPQIASPKKSFDRPERSDRYDRFDRPRQGDRFDRNDRGPRAGIKPRDKDFPVGKAGKPRLPNSAFADVMVDVGYENHVEPKHLVGAITERSGLSGYQVGKIEIFDNQAVVGVPADRVDEVLTAMKGCKICGKVTETVRLAHAMPSHKAKSQSGASKSAFFAGQRLAKHEGEPVKAKAPAKVKEAVHHKQED